MYFINNYIFGIFDILMFLNIKVYTFYFTWETLKIWVPLTFVLLKHMIMVE
jgi:hypothetical protein